MRALALAVLGAWACTDAGARVVPKRVEDAGVTRAAQASPPSLPSPAPTAPSEAPAARTAEPTLRVVTSTLSATPLSEPLTLGPDDALALGLDDIAQVRVRGPATIAIAPEGAPGLLVREGMVVVDVAPHGARAGERPLWVGTPGGRIEVAQAARFVLRAFADGASTLTLVSGHLRVRQGGDEQLFSGDAARCFTAVDHVSIAPIRGNLEARIAALARARSCRKGARGSDAARDAALTAQLAQRDALHARARSLLAEHARLVAARSPEAALVQATIAREAAAMFALTETVRAGRVALDARLLGTKPKASAAALQARAARGAPYR